MVSSSSTAGAVGSVVVIGALLGIRLRGGASSLAWITGWRQAVVDHHLTDLDLCEVCRAQRPEQRGLPRPAASGRRRAARTERRRGAAQSCVLRDRGRGGRPGDACVRGRGGGAAARL